MILVRLFTESLEESHNITFMKPKTDQPFYLLIVSSRVCGIFRGIVINSGTKRLMTTNFTPLGDSITTTGRSRMFCWDRP